MSLPRFFPVAVALACIQAVPASAQVPAELRAAMLSRDSAVAKADAVTWDRLTAETFTVVQGDGSLKTKAERIAELRTQTPRPLSTLQREQVTMYGDVAVRRFLSGDGWVLDVWSKAGGRWRVVAVQVTTAKK